MFPLILIPRRRGRLADGLVGGGQTILGSVRICSPRRCRHPMAGAACASESLPAQRYTEPPLRGRSIDPCAGWRVQRHREGIALQEDGLFIHGQLLLPGGFFSAVIPVIRGRFGEACTHRQLDGVLFLRHAQAGDQLLVDHGVCLDASQHWHRIVNDGLLIIQRPGRIFFSGNWIYPRLREELGKSVS